MLCLFEPTTSSEISMYRSASLRLTGLGLFICSSIAAGQRATSAHVGARTAYPPMAAYLDGGEFSSVPVAPSSDVLDRALVRSAVPAARSSRSHWPWFALGGAAIGSGTVALVALASCDANCRDDGALGQVGPIVAIGAVVGAVAGALIGLYVDSRR